MNISSRNDAKNEVKTDYKNYYETELTHTQSEVVLPQFRENI
jgi:hypothetical protein